jgi:ATP-dependent protease ClpP protease subunit
MQESNANIVCSVEGICMSAATLIFLSGDRFELSDHTMFMFHNYSSGTIGKGGEMYDQITHFRAWSEKLFNSFYRDFLTPEEIKSMLDNKDIWLDAEEVAKRLEARVAKEQEPEEAPKKARKKTAAQ